MKDRYRDILDAKDITLTFSNDDVFRKAMNGVNEHINKLLIIWASFIVVMIFVVIIFGRYGLQMDADCLFERIGML